MKKWMVFFSERAPVGSYFLMCLGPTLSSYYLNNKQFDLRIIFSFLGLFIFFNILRMMDEFKDYQKDVIAHPTRPLPRGLIELTEFKAGINISLLLMLLFNGSMLFWGLKLSFFLYTLVMVHLWLMYKEFYLGDWLNQYPLVYAVTHQLILIPLMLFALSTLRSPLTTFHTIDWIYAFSVLFSFFTYEVCRKLDPNAHEILKTYRYIYGLGGVIAIVGILSFFQIMNLFFLYKNNFFQLVFDFLAIFIIVLLVLLKANKCKFKMIEAMATLNLILFLYSGIIYAITTH